MQYSEARELALMQAELTGLRADYSSMTQHRDRQADTIRELMDEVDDLTERNRRQASMIEQQDGAEEYLQIENNLLWEVIRGIQGGKGVQTLLRIQAEDHRQFERRFEWLESQVYDLNGNMPPDEEPDFDRENPRE